jgi:hypothetical protein
MASIMKVLLATFITAAGLLLLTGDPQGQVTKEASPKEITLPAPIDRALVAQNTREHLAQNPQDIAVTVVRGRPIEGFTGNQIAILVLRRFDSEGMRTKPFIVDGDMNEDTAVTFTYGDYVYGPLNAAQALKSIPTFSALVREKQNQTPIPRGDRR